MSGDNTYRYRCRQCGTRNNVPADKLGQVGKCGKCGAPLETADLLRGEPILAADANFEQMVLKSPLPVLMFCWAPWCPSCGAMAPVVDAFAQEAKGRIRVAKLNVDPNPRLSAQFDIRSVPFIFVFDNGQLKESFPGGGTKHDLMLKMSRYL